MIKSIPVTADMKRTALLWSLPVLSILAVYNNFTDTNELMFKISTETTYTAPAKSKAQPKTNKQFQILSVNGLNTFNASNVKLIQAQFAKYDYDLSTGRVPRIQPNKIPSNLNDILNVKTKKETFIKLMLPLAIDINNHIMEKQLLLNEIIADYNDDKKLSNVHLTELKHLGVEFGVKIRTNKYETAFKQLKTKVKTIPVSLVLAQAIVESGWGTSRFAVLGNALFGQWTYSSKSDLIPINRDDGKTHSIKSFTSPYQSMKAYMTNLNRNRAYKKLRDIRNSSWGKVSGIKLADGLINYSQEREVYVNKIKSIIKNNNLAKYDNYTLIK